MAYKHHDDGEDYKVVSYVDVNEFLQFAKQEHKSLEEEIREERRIEEELKGFIKHIEKHSKHKINFIGHDKSLGTHIVRFLFKDGGFLEVLVEKPLSINAHFNDKKSADEFAKGLKKALEITLPNHPIKNMVIESVEVSDGFKDELLTFNKWTKMHKIAIHKTLVVTIVAVVLLLFMEFIKELLKEYASHFIHLPTIAFSFMMAILLVIFFEPIKNKVEHIIEKLF